jgi:PadR family transcriptional regulator PadR
MITLVNTATALVVELLRGPGYGLDLIERVRVRGRGRILLRQGVVYPALRELARRKILRTWSVSAPGGGRPRTYFDLTPKGLELAEAHREAIEGLAARVTSPRPTRGELEAMRNRLYECGDISEAASKRPRASRQGSNRLRKH